MHRTNQDELYRNFAVATRRACNALVLHVIVVPAVKALNPELAVLFDFPIRFHKSRALAVWNGSRRAKLTLGCASAVLKPSMLADDAKDVLTARVHGSVSAKVARVARNGALYPRGLADLALLAPLRGVVVRATKPAERTKLARDTGDITETPRGARCAQRPPRERASLSQLARLAHCRTRVHAHLAWCTRIARRDACARSKLPGNARETQRLTLLTLVVPGLTSAA